MSRQDKLSFRAGDDDPLMFCCKSVAGGFSWLHLMLQVTLTEGSLLKLKICSLGILKYWQTTPPLHRRGEILFYVNVGGFGQILVANLFLKGGGVLGWTCQGKERNEGTSSSWETGCEPRKLLGLSWLVGPEAGNHQRAKLLPGIK